MSAIPFTHLFHRRTFHRSGARRRWLRCRPESDLDTTTACARSEGLDESIYAFVGLPFEARIAAGPGVIVSYPQSKQCPAALLPTDAVMYRCRGILSFGIAGGLSPDLRPGDWIVASAVVDGQVRYGTDLVLSRKLLVAVTGAEYVPIVGIDAPVVDPAAKRHLYETTGAAAVDMESHLVAAFASANALPFAALRVVIDPAHRRVPRAALVGLRQGGRSNPWSVLAELAKSPGEFSLVVRLAMDAIAARHALMTTRRKLGVGLGLMEQKFHEHVDAYDCGLSV